MAKRTLSADEAVTANGSGRGARTLIERTYLRLREDIVEGRLEPGLKLRVEHLKDDYAVSAGTLREALARLVSDALVIAEGQRGFTVAPMSLEEMIDVTNLRVAIETAALRTAIQNSDAAWRVRLTKVFERLSLLELPLLPSNRLTWEAANAQFHEALLVGGASPWTFRVLRQLTSHCERYRRRALTLPSTGRDVHQEHQQIYDSAMAGQDARAALALENHIRMTADVLVQAVRQGQSTLE